jgi:hypothetical protein
MIYRLSCKFIQIFAQRNSNRQSVDGKIHGNSFRRKEYFRKKVRTYSLLQEDLQISKDITFTYKSMISSTIVIKLLFSILLVLYFIC